MMNTAQQLLLALSEEPEQLYEIASKFDRGGEQDEEYKIETFLFADGSELICSKGVWHVHPAPPEYEGLYSIQSHLRAISEPAYWNGETWLIDDLLAGTINLQHFYVINWGYC